MDELCLPTTIGAEMEFIVMGDDGKPVDFELFMREVFGADEWITPYGTLTGEFVRWQGEVRLTPAPFNEPERLFEHARDFFTKKLAPHLKPNWNLIFQGDVRPLIKMDNNELRTWMSRKKRYQALLDALDRLVPNASTTVLKLMFSNATHIHVSDGPYFDPFTNDVAIMLMNHLNHRGLQMASEWDACLNLAPPKRNSTFWSDFAPPERYPRWRPWESSSEYRAFVESIPRLIYIENEEAGVDLETPGSIVDPLHRGTLWHGVRAAGTNGQRWIEYRYPSSMSPGQFGSFLSQFCNEVRMCLQRGTPTLLTEKEWDSYF